MRFFIKAALFSLILSPLSAHAGIIDTVSGWFNSTSAVLASSTPSTAKLALLEAAVNSNPTGSLVPDTLSVVDGQALLNESGVSGTISDVIDKTSSDQISIYVVRKGDTLSGVAKMYGVSVNTIKWANDLTGSPKEGDVLVILPVSGIKYIVKKGDTLSSIAKKYKADIDEIKQFNGLEGALSVGDEIIIPDAEISTPVATSVKSSGSSGTTDSSGPSYSGYYIRPLVGGRKSQGLHGHNGVDLAGLPVGTSVKASAAGTVIVAKVGGYNGGYGNYVVISHSNGTQTLYGHLNSVAVTRGQVVEQGETIGGLGNTGRSTGPHLHFEIRGAKNPF